MVTTKAAGGAAELDPHRVSGRRAAAWFGVLLLLAVVLHVAAFTVDVFNPDETYLATQADVITHGGSLYQDAADRKPPLVPYLYAAAFEVEGSRSLIGPRVLAMLAAALTAFLVSVEAARRWGRRAGRIGGVLCLFLSVAFLPIDGQAANFEIFMLPATVAAFVLARRERWAASGVAIAAATLAKQTGAAMLLPIAYLAVRGRRARPLAIVLVGTVVPVVAVAVAMGFHDFVFFNYFSNGAYVSPGSFSDVVNSFVNDTSTWLWFNIPTVLLVALAWRDRHRRVVGDERENDLWLWLLASIVSVAVGLRFFGHYYLQLVPAAALLGTGALVRRSARLATAALAVTATIAVVGAVLGYVVRTPDVLSERTYTAIARAVDARTRPSDGVVFWGTLPEVFWASHRRPATRFVTTLSFLSGIQQGRARGEVDIDSSTREMRTDFLHDFDAHPPALIVDVSTNGYKGSDLAPLSKFPRFAARVKADYCYAATVKRMVLYERREPGRTRPCRAAPA